MELSDRSVGKVLAMQVYRPEFDTQNSPKKLNIVL